MDNRSVRPGAVLLDEMLNDIEVLSIEVPDFDTPFVRDETKDLLAIRSAGVSRGRNGFRKDKSGEKLAESEESLLEHRTDGTDAFDTLYIGCEKFPYRDSFSLSMSGVI